MNADEKRSILSRHLAEFRAWSYADLAARIDGGHLAIMEGKAGDGTEYFIDFDIFWDDKPQGNIRVIGNFWADQRPLLGFLPIYRPDVSDCFIMGPDGRFVGE